MRYVCTSLDYVLLDVHQGCPYDLCKIGPDRFVIARYTHSDKSYPSLKLACRVVARSNPNKNMVNSPSSLSLRRDSLHSELPLRAKTGGGGIRTPVPRCFKTSVYMLSRFIIHSPCQKPNDRPLVRLFRRVLTEAGPNNRLGQPAI